MKWIVNGILLFTVFFFYRCTLEEATREAADELVIVSDYLKVSDSSLFHDYSQFSGVNIRIVNRSADDIIGDFRNKGYATGYDIIMLGSLFDVNRFSKYGFFHDLSDVPENSRFSSGKYDYIGFGIDPFVFAYNDDSTLLHKNYSDLLVTPYASNLSASDEIPMIAFIMSKMKKGKTFEWLQKFEGKRKKSIDSETTILTTYSSYVSLDKKDSLYRHINSVHFPDQSDKGAYFNLRTFAIVSQAERFTETSSFIQYYMDEQKNQRLCNDLHVFGIQNGLRLYNSQSEKMLPYYGMIERMLNRLN